MKIFVLAREDGTLAWPYVGFLTSEKASDNAQESGPFYVTEIDVPARKGMVLSPLASVLEEIKESEQCPLCGGPTARAGTPVARCINVLCPSGSNVVRGYINCKLDKVLRSERVAAGVENQQKETESNEHDQREG